MTRYQEESQRAAGPASASPSQPNPLVTPGGSNALRTGPKPSVSRVAEPASHTSAREPSSARALSRRAIMRSSSASSPAQLQRAALDHGDRRRRRAELRAGEITVECRVAARSASMMMHGNLESHRTCPGMHDSALQGGSTITMQLVRNVYLADDRRTIRQKIVEARLALEYEKHHGKRSILTSYLNSVPYGTVGGQTAIGVQAAARIFFDKPASQLDLQQSALLAGLPQAPSQYNPFGDAAAAKKRRNQVLAKMQQLHYV